MTEEKVYMWINVGVYKCGYVLESLIRPLAVEWHSPSTILRPLTSWNSPDTPDTHTLAATLWDGCTRDPWKHVYTYIITTLKYTCLYKLGRYKVLLVILSMAFISYMYVLLSSLIKVYVVYGILFDTKWP